MYIVRLFPLTCLFGQTISQNIPLETFEVSSPRILVLWSHLSMVLRFVLIGVNFVWEVCLSHPFKTERGQNICSMKSSPSIPLQLNFIIIFFALSTPKACHTLWKHELWLAKSCVSITVCKHGKSVFYFLNIKFSSLS